MGYSTESAVRFFDETIGYDQIRFGSLGCKGDEESVLKCPMKEIFPMDCYPARVAGVCCGEPHHEVKQGRYRAMVYHQGINCSILECLK